MELYPSGLLPQGYPTLDLTPIAGLPSGLKAAAPAAAGGRVDCLTTTEPCQVAVAMGSSSLSSPEDDRDMEFLEGLLRQCHLDGVAAEQAAASAASVAAGLPESMNPSCNPNTVAAAATQDSQLHAATLAQATHVWADELVRKMQACSSAEEARPQCAEMLLAFHQQQQQQQQQQLGDASAQRLRTLQGANSALLRGFRNMYHRHQTLTAQHKRAEELFLQMASELEKTQEALRASERAKSTLQYHLQLMSAGPSTAAGGM